MGYGRALLQKDVRSEEASLQKKAKKKSLWGSIGRTVGGLGVMALTGGAVNDIASLAAKINRIIEVLHLDDV